MRKASTMQCALLRFCVSFLILAISFSYYTPSVFATTTEFSGNEVNTNEKVVNKELAKSSLKVPEEEEKFKGFIPKQIPILKPVPKIIPFYKPVPKIIPVVKPVSIPVYKPVPKLIPIVKPKQKPFEVKKAMAGVESEEFLKPKPFFKKSIPKLPLHPKFKLPIHKPIIPIP